MFGTLLRVGGAVAAVAAVSAVVSVVVNVVLNSDTDDRLDQLDNNSLFHRDELHILRNKVACFESAYGPMEDLYVPPRATG